MPLVRITQERSKIRCIERHKRTLAALGLRRINHSVVHEDTPQIRGMVDLVRYLVRIEPAEEGAARGDAAPAAKQRKRVSQGKKKGSGLKAAAQRKTKARARTPREATRARKKRATRS